MGVYKHNDGSYEVQYKNPFKKVYLRKRGINYEDAVKTERIWNMKYGVPHRKSELINFQNKFCYEIGKIPEEHHEKYLFRSKMDHSLFVGDKRSVVKDRKFFGAPRVYRKPRALKKANYFSAAFCIDGENFTFGKYDDLASAKAEALTQLDDYYFCGQESPNIHHEKVKNVWRQDALRRKLDASRNKKGRRDMLSHKYITFDGRYFVFQFQRHGFKISKVFKSLPQATDYRNKFLEERDLPIPDDRKD